jgi:beta-lactamase class A
MDRREFTLRATLAMAAGLALARQAAAVTVAQKNLGNGDTHQFSNIESGVRGRLGVAVLDTASGEIAGHRLDERFAMCSTFKAVAAGAVLARVDAGHDSLDRRIVVAQAALVSNSPITSKHLGGAGMRLGDLCEAAITVSDNTAGNLLLETIGGPPGFTRFARGLGDAVTRLDRTETALNEAAPGDPRDTSTPRAMAVTLRALTFGDALPPASREQLLQWMRATRTGAQRLRAGLPADWRMANKTGTGELGTTNEIAVLWPPGHAPLVVIAYLTQCAAPEDDREAALAEVGRRIAGPGWRWSA